MENFEHVNTLFTDPVGFIEELYFAFISHKDLIVILFSERMDILISKIEKMLLEQYSGLSVTPEKQILMEFLLWGGSHILMESRFEEAVMLETITKAAEEIIAMINVDG
jgi:hypothetical protein